MSKIQNKYGNYMKQVSAKSTPQNNVRVVNTLADSQKAIDNLSRNFGYDYIGNIYTLENEINNGSKNKAKNAMYADNGMTGMLNIGMKKGKFKENQEDSILILSHPENKNFRIALVADGVGGQERGDAASYLATLLTRDWFKRLPKQFFNYDVLNIKYQNGTKLTVRFDEMIKTHLVDINNQILKQLGDLPGTTFSAAITRNKNGKDTVTSISIGDSKILKISDDGQVVQLSKDDNLLSEGIREGSIYVEDSSSGIYTTDKKYSSRATYKQKESKSKTHVLNQDDMRFYKDNNIITECLGAGRTRTKFKRKIKFRKSKIYNRTLF